MSTFRWILAAAGGVILLLTWLYAVQSSTALWSAAVGMVLFLLSMGLWTRQLRKKEN